MAPAKILIVDNDQDIRRLLGIRLKARGYEPVFAGDAISAVNQARKEHPTSSSSTSCSRQGTAISLWSV